MIIELHSNQVNNTLFTAWEIPEYAWENRKDFILKLFYKYFNKYNLKFSQIDWQENLIFNVLANESEFNHIENVFNKYFDTIKVLNVVH